MSDELDARNDQIGQTLAGLRAKYTPPARMSGEDREEWFAANLTPEDYATLQAARNSLVETNYGFILRQAEKFRFSTNDNADLDEIVAGGALGLLYSAWDWDHTKGKLTTFATARLFKAMQQANDASSPLEKRYNREYIVEANRLATEMPGATIEERAAASKIKHLRDHPEMLREWTAVAQGWVGRIEMDAHDYENDDEDSGGIQVAAPVGRGLADNDALWQVLTDYLDPVDALIVVFARGLDGHAEVPMKDIVVEARSIFPEFPAMKTSEVQVRYKAALEVLVAKGDAIRDVLVPA